MHEEPGTSHVNGPVPHVQALPWVQGELFRKAAELRKAQDALDAELKAIDEQTAGLDEADKAHVADLLAGKQVPLLQRSIVASAGL